jgi:hypothetical protein
LGSGLKRVCSASDVSQDHHLEEQNMTTEPTKSTKIGDHALFGNPQLQELVDSFETDDPAVTKAKVRAVGAEIRADAQARRDRLGDNPTDLPSD